LAKGGGEASYDFLAMDKLSVAYTQMGLQTTLPDQKMVTNTLNNPASSKIEVIGGIEIDWEAPCTVKREQAPWDSKQLIMLTVTIPRKWYYVGEKIEMTVEIRNMTEKTIKSLFCTLGKRLNPVPKEALRTLLLTKKEDIVVDTELYPQGFPVKSRFRSVHRVIFKLPFNLEPTVCKDGSARKNFYYLQVRAKPTVKNGPVVVVGPIKLKPRIVE